MPRTGSGKSNTRITKPTVETIARSASVAVAGIGRPSSKRRDKCGRTKSTTPLASTHAKHVHADNQSSTVTDLENKQQVPSVVIAVPRGVGPAVKTASRVEKSSQRPSDTFSPSMVPQALNVSAASRKINEKINHQDLLSCNANRETRFDAFHASAMNERVSQISHSSQLDVKARTSKRQSK